MGITQLQDLQEKAELALQDYIKSNKATIDLVNVIAILEIAIQLRFMNDGNGVNQQP